MLLDVTEQTNILLLVRVTVVAEEDALVHAFHVGAAAYLTALRCD